ncbi:alpha/beta fold hydrolase [Aliamphritea spongicola]|uniref:alpha/beta fold hydrolase n=1 Tax=Aliamphritea spongicola TaxID=707589 RepID=UPI00196AC080|nr:alpha/beta fold hydrolase [Aliamphritea spongicola]MBN3564515.1 alpha/beta fold hydrolase [Aliamphritea spongicola]
MQLHVNIQGQGEPLIILHGLFGTLENWGSQIKVLAEQYQVYAVDLRNHGRSPHSDEMTYAAMADDIAELMDNHGLQSAHILGHSMGGKAAMQLALTQPERIRQLIIVDIAPVQYSHDHDTVIQGLKSVRLDTVTSRREAEQQLAEQVTDTGLRQFLLKNLYRSENGFAWRMNLAVIESQYANISAPPEGNTYQGNTLFIKGGQSEYITLEHKDALLQYFPAASYKIIQNAGHWPHAEKPAAFSKLVLNFLQENN